MSDSLWPHELQHTRVCSDSCPLSQWCHTTISSSVVPFFSCPQLCQGCFFFLFSSKSTLCIRWPKYWSFSFSINPSNIYLGLISFRIDRFNLAVQGTLTSLLKSSLYSYQLCIICSLSIYLSHINNLNY